MKLLFTTALLLAAAAAAPAADSVSGKWKIHTNIAGNESDQTCTFAPKDADVAISCTSEKGTMTMAGKVDGKKVSWTFKSEYNGSPLTVNYEGKLDSDTKLSGTVNVVEFSVDGEFTGVPAE